MRLAGLILLLASPLQADPTGKIFWAQVNERDEIAVYQKILHPSRAGAGGRLPPALGTGEVEEMRVAYDYSEPGGHGRQGQPRTDFPRMHLTSDRLGYGYLGCRGTSYDVNGAARRVIPPGRSNLGVVVPDPTASGASPGSEEPNYFFTEDGAGIGYFFPSAALFPSRDADGKYICQLYAMTSLAFPGPTGGPGSARPSRILLHRLPSAGGGPPTDLGLAGMQPALSPDGRVLAYVLREASGSRLMLVWIEIGGAGIQDSSFTTLAMFGEGMEDRRFSHPAWRSDGRALVFASDAASTPTEDSWNLYGVHVDPADRSPTPLVLTPQSITAAQAASGPPASYPELRVITQSPHQDVWPSFSPDGRHVLFASADDADSPHEIYVKEVPEDLTPADTARPAEPVSRGRPGGDAEDCAWPAWFQDLFAPSMWIELTPQDSGEDAVVSLRVAPEVKSLGGRDVELKASGRHLTPKFETAFDPPDPVKFGVVPDPRNGRMALGFNLAGQGGYEDAASGTTLRSLTDVAGDAGAHAPLTGFYVNKDARINIKVIVRDNHHGARYKAGIQDWDYALDPSRIDPSDTDASYPMFGAPYMPMADREPVLAGDPGFSWWFEDEAHQPLADSVNAPEFVFRFGNVDEEGKVERPLWFRAVARDLWGHVTEISMPVFVYRTSVEIEKLNSGIITGGKEKGKKVGP